MEAAVNSEETGELGRECCASVSRPGPTVSQSEEILANQEICVSLIFNV